MSRSGYTEDCENIAMWRGRVASAIRGRRGQAFFRRLIAALDAMPTRELIAEDLANDDGVCALGACLRDDPELATLDPENHGALGAKLDIASCLVAEVEYQNDEHCLWDPETPAHRWLRVRKWAETQLRDRGKP